MATEPASKPDAVMNPLPASPNALPECLIDAFQRSVLFLELRRERGNEQVEITAHLQATVLRYDHEILLSGRLLPRLFNYYLARIRPPLESCSTRTSGPWWRWPPGRGRVPASLAASMARWSPG